MTQEGQKWNHKKQKNNALIANGVKCENFSTVPQTTWVCWPNIGTTYIIALAHRCILTLAQRISAKWAYVGPTWWLHVGPTLYGYMQYIEPTLAHCMKNEIHVGTTLDQRRNIFSYVDTMLVQGRYFSFLCWQYVGQLFQPNYNGCCMRSCIW